MMVAVETGAKTQICPYQSRKDSILIYLLIENRGLHSKMFGGIFLQN